MSAFETVTGAHYRLTEDDFECGYIRTDAVTGRATITGISANSGLRITSVLDEPLCGGCDQPIPSHGICLDCCQLHADLLTECRGDPFGERFAA